VIDLLLHDCRVVRPDGSTVEGLLLIDDGRIEAIETGSATPGVALGMPGQPHLRACDKVELGITGLGRQRQRFVAAP
jgi:hypothetical protein